MCETSVIRKTETLNRILYFTTLPSSPTDKVNRHRLFLKLLSAQSHPIELYFGKFYHTTHRCNKCSHEYTQHHEKRTDVNIAVNMVKDVFNNDFDIAYVISGDSDLVPPIEFRVKAFGRSYAIYYFANLDLYVKGKTETTQPGFQTSRSSLTKVTKEFGRKVFEAFEVF